MINLIDVPLLSRGSCLVIIPYTGINGEARDTRDRQFRLNVRGIYD